MPRPTLSEETKQCRQDLRVLAQWGLRDDNQVERAGYLTWLAGYVDIEWGRKGRPADLGNASSEAGSILGGLVQHGTCEVSGELGKVKIWLVQPIKELEKTIERMDKIDAEARLKARERLRSGDWIAVGKLLPAAWKAPLIKKVGQRLWRAPSSRRSWRG